jgi:hypothetical protein
MKKTKTDIIREFVTAIYDELFDKKWNKKMPSLNEAKEWIAGFAFVYREASDKFWADINLNTANKIQEEMEAKGLSLTEESITAYLNGSDKEKQTKKYIHLILNNENNN